MADASTPLPIRISIRPSACSASSVKSFCPARQPFSCPEVKIVSIPRSTASSSVLYGSLHTSKALCRVTDMFPASSISAFICSRFKVPSGRRHPMTTPSAPSSRNSFTSPRIIRNSCSV